MNKTKTKSYLKKYMMIIALVTIWAIFTIMTKGSFFTSRNISNLFRQAVITSVLAIGMVLVIIIGEIDLSIGSIVGLTGGIVAILDVWLEVNPVISIVITLLAGILVGLWNGWWIAYKKVPSFIATLGGMLIFRGILVGITKGTTIGPMTNTFKVLGKGYVDGNIGYLIFIIVSGIFVYNIYKQRKEKKSYKLKLQSVPIEILKTLSIILLGLFFVYAMNSYRGIANSLLLLLVIASIFVYITKNTVFGRNVYAIGGNSKASILSGIKIKQKILLVFVINGLMGAIAGILLTSRLNSASVASGSGAELDAIASAVIGGASLSGGIGTVIGAVIGAVVMASLDNGMSLMNTPMFWQSIIKGLVLIFAVWFDVSNNK